MSFIFSNIISVLWIFPLLQKIFIFLDSVFYVLAEAVYGLFELSTLVNLTKVGIAFETVVKNVMGLVAIFILFRLAIIFLQFLLDPEKFKNNETGGSKIIINVFVVIAMLALVYSNFLFGLINDLQLMIFSNGNEEYSVLGQFGFENKKVNLINNIFSSEDYTRDNYGRWITSKVFNSFLYVEGPCEDDPSQTCITDWFEIGENTDSGYDCNFENGNKRLFCLIAHDPKSSFLDLINLDTSPGTGLKYIPIASLVAAIYLIFIFFKLTIDIFIRSIKLFILQIVSPIAIVSYIDPGKGKTIFNNFWKYYIKTYLELFLKLLTIYLTIYFINVGVKILSSTDLFPSSVGFFVRSLLKVVFIFASLNFIKVLPKILEEIFGFSFDSSQKGQFGKVLGGIVGAGVGLGAGIATASKSGLGFGAGAFQALGGAYQGANKGRTANNFGDLIRGQIANSQAIGARSKKIAEAGGLINYATPGKTARMKETIDAHNNYNKNLDSFMDSYKNQYARANGSEQNYVDKNTDVIAARLKEKQLQDSYVPGSLTGPTETDISNAIQDRIKAENTAKENYDNAVTAKFNADVLSRRSGSTTVFDKSTEEAYQKTEGDYEKIKKSYSKSERENYRLDPRSGRGYKDVKDNNNRRISEISSSRRINP